MTENHMVCDSPQQLWALEHLQAFFWKFPELLNKMIYILRSEVIVLNLPKCILNWIVLKKLAINAFLNTRASISIHSVTFVYLISVCLLHFKLFNDDEHPVKCWDAVNAFVPSQSLDGATTKVCSYIIWFIDRQFIQHRATTVRHKIIVWKQVK